MIISPPFLPARQANQSDEQYIAAAMNGDAPGQGSFPVSFRLNWHGGLHLQAPQGPNGPLPVRAIADGTVVLVRDRTPRPSEGQRRREHELGYYRGWTDNGVVVIRHETEIGEGADGSLTFYSIYQHLRQIPSTVRTGQQIHRKEELGQAGHIYGQPNQFQLEIVCDDANLRRMIGRAEGDLPAHTDGRTDSVYGELYFMLPPGTAIMDRNPQAAPPAPPRRGQTAPVLPAPRLVHSTSEQLFVGLRYAAGDAILTTYTASGTVVGTPLVDENNEYNLYTEATRLYPRCPSAGYELLRFGRVLGPDELDPTDAEHWRRIRYSGGDGWVNLNAVGIRKFSDADFPHWRGWQLVDAEQGDSRCNSNLIIRAVDQNRDGTVTREEAQQKLLAQPTQALMKRLVCRFQTEWDAATIDARYGWLRQDSALSHSGDLVDTEAESLAPADFDRLRAHMQTLSFWDEGSIGLSAKHWHFHPREFIRHFRQCYWLSATELARVYPNAVYPVRALELEGRGRNPSEIREQYRDEINKVARKYFVNTPTRLAYFFGQGAVESMFLTLMIEGSANFSRNPRHASFQPEGDGYYVPASRTDYLYYLEGRLGNVDFGDGPKFRGRGMKQLTGRENYAKYWVYRGWLDRSTFDASWWQGVRRLGPPVIGNPQQLSVDVHSCIDAGGWYWEAGAARAQFRSINRLIHEGDVSDPAVERVTRAINGGVNGLAARQGQTQRIAEIFSDLPNA